MKTKQLLSKNVEKLNKANLPQVEARFILEYCLNCSYAELIHQYEEEVSQEIESKYEKLLTERLSGRPLQYIIGEQNFFGYDFYVDENVLIPRPETELLVEKIVSHIKNKVEDKNDGIRKRKQIKILDMCTGSGCIPITLYMEMASILEGEGIKLEIYAVDISKEALKVAKKNEEKVMEGKGHIYWIESNMFESLYNMKSLNTVGFDIIISNPPYIDTKDMLMLDIEVREYEPNLALHGGEDGLCFYHNIAQSAKDFLLKSGKLFLEIGYNQMYDVKKILKENGYDKIEGCKDLSSHDRMIVCEQP